MQLPRMDLMSPALKGELQASIRDGIDDAQMRTKIGLRSKGEAAFDLEAGTYGEGPVSWVNAIRRLSGEMDVAEGRQRDRVYLVDAENVEGIRWIETFESEGFDNTYSVGQTVDAGDGSTPTFDPDASAPSGFDGLGVCLNVVHPGDGTGAGSTKANVETDGLNAARFVAEWDVVVNSESFASGDQLFFLAFWHGAALVDLIATFGVRYMIAGEPNEGIVSLWAGIYEDGSRTPYATTLATGTLYRNRFMWDTDAETFSWSVNGSELASGSISGTPLSESLTRFAIGTQSNGSDIAIDYSLGSVRLSDPLLTVDEIIDGEDVFQVVSFEKDPLDAFYQIRARAA